MDTLFQDLKYATRQLWKDKGFLLTAWATLALCIGANTAIFGIVNTVILQPLPTPEPERLVTMWNAYPGAGVGEGVRGRNGVPDFYDRRELTEVFEELTAFRNRGFSVEIEGTAQRVRGMQVTPSYFRVLYAQPDLGRTFTEEEGELGNHRVVVLSHGFWEQLYAADPSAIGGELRINGEPYTIVGVMPAEFDLIGDNARFWSALAFDPEDRQNYHSNNYSMLARLQPGVTLAQAQAQVDALNVRNLDLIPQLKPLLIDAGFHTPLYLLQEDIVGDMREVLFLLWGGVAFVLLIGCVNVANLVLVRSTARSKELATRFALGARRSRVGRQLLTEAVVLTMGSAVVGLVAGHLGLQALAAVGLEQMPRAAEIGLDITAVAFTFALALVVGAIVALIPLASIVRVDLSAVFREEGRTGTAGRGGSRASQGDGGRPSRLCAGAAGRGWAPVGELRRAARHRHPGFTPEGVLTGELALSSSAYPDAGARRTFTDELLQRTRALPGVESVGITSQIPFGGSYSDSVIFAEGYVMEPGESVVSPLNNVVTPGYFEAMGIPIVAGRSFDTRDSQDGQPVIIIDQRLADRFYPEGDAVGKRMWAPDSAAAISDPTNAPHFEIIGVTAAIRMRGLAAGLDRTGAYYFPYDQQPRGNLDLAIKTGGDPEALIGSVREVIRELDADLPLFDVHTMSQRVSDSLGDRRTPLLLAAGFSIIAVLLAAVGIYGVLAYLVQLRTKEMGIRVALGSDAGGIFRMILREGMLVLAAGLLLGLAGTAMLRRFIESQLYGVSALDPGVMAAVVTLLGGVALVACMIPAWRATRIDPVAALTQE